LQSARTSAGIPHVHPLRRAKETAMRHEHACRTTARALASVTAALCCLATAAAHAAFEQTNLVSNVPLLAVATDPNLRNPWGIATTATSPFWVGDNAAGLSTLYNTAGTPQALVVTIPPPPGSTLGTQGEPTGVAFNSSGAPFRSVGSADTFLFATEGGTVAGWRPALGTTAETLIDNSASGAAYTGIAVSGAAATARLYVANFGNGGIDVFDSLGASIPGGFLDPNLPAGYAPFNIQDLGGTMYVTYAMVDTTTGDAVTGAGLGFVDAFDASGNLLRRVASHGALNAPWGLALAPAGFGEFGGALLVGNFGDGLINAFDPITGVFQGTLSDAVGNPLRNDGLWGLQFGNGGNGGASGTLYFAAGINNQVDGLFGSIRPAAAVPEPGMAYLLIACALATVVTRRTRRVR